MDFGRQDLRGHVLKRCDVIDDHHAPAVRGKHQIVVPRMHEHVVDPGRAQAGHEAEVLVHVPG